MRDLFINALIGVTACGLWTWFCGQVFVIWFCGGV